MEQKFSLYAFARECYLRSVPSVDLNSGVQVDGRYHYLMRKEFEMIQFEFGIRDLDGTVLNADAVLDSMMWALNSGPKVI